MRLRRVACLLASLLVARASAGEDTLAGQGAADRVFRHGTFYTVAGPEPVRGSLAVRGGRILFVGDDAGAMALAGPRTEVVELAGRAVTPGLIDAHSHLLGFALDLAHVDLRGAASFDEVVSRVQAAAAKAPAGQWLLGRGWDQNRWPGKQLPTHDALSRAVPAHPVYLVRIDGHAGLLNAAGMRAQGITRATADPAGGRYLRDAAGEPTGLVLDRAKEEVETRLPEPALAQVLPLLREAAARCLAVGLTAVTDMGIDHRGIAAYDAAIAQGGLGLRVAAFLTDQEPLLSEWFARGIRVDADGRFEIRGVKMYADGALGSRGAALVEPYRDDPSNLGLLVTSGDHMTDVARRARAAGFQVGVHGIGDRGNLVALDALERGLGGAHPELRWRIEHAQVLRLQDIERLARLGVIASMQPTHATSDMGWAEDRLGPGRLEGAYAWRKVLKAGGRLALGSDFPVESIDPRLGLYAAVTRQDLAGKPEGGWHPEERLTRVEALRGFTLDAAYALFWEREIGSLEAGKRADLVVWARDPMTVPAAELATVAVDLTVVDGRTAFARKDAR